MNNSIIDQSKAARLHNTKINMDPIDKELQDLLKDPLLCDINQFTSLNQVKHLIQLERGSLIKLTLLRGSLQAIGNIAFIC
jgi:hypothetical protein